MLVTMCPSIDHLAERHPPPPARASGNVSVAGVEKPHTAPTLTQKQPVCGPLLKTDATATLCARLLHVFKGKHMHTKIAMIMLHEDGLFLFLKAWNNSCCNVKMFHLCQKPLAIYLLTIGHWHVC